MNNLDKEFDKFIRDVTRVFPRPKSEVRKRLEEIIRSREEKLLKEIEEWARENTSNHECEVLIPNDIIFMDDLLSFLKEKIK